MGSVRVAGTAGAAALLALSMLSAGAAGAEESAESGHEQEPGIEATAFLAPTATRVPLRKTTLLVPFARNSSALSTRAKARISTFFDNFPEGTVLRSVVVVGRADMKCRDVLRARGDVCPWEVIAGERAEATNGYVSRLVQAPRGGIGTRGIDSAGPLARTAKITVRYRVLPTIPPPPPPPPIPTTAVTFTNGTAVVNVGGTPTAAAVAPVSFTYPCVQNNAVATCTENTVAPNPVPGYSSLVREVVFTSGSAQVSVTVQAAEFSPGNYWAYYTDPTCTPPFSDPTSATTTFTCTVSESSPALGVFLALF